MQQGSWIMVHPFVEQIQHLQAFEARPEQTPGRWAQLIRRGRCNPNLNLVFRTLTAHSFLTKVLELDFLPKHAKPCTEPAVQRFGQSLSSHDDARVVRHHRSSTDPAQRMPGFSVKGAEGGKTKTTHEENYFRCVHNAASHSGLKIWHHRQMWRQVRASVFKMTLNDLVHIAFSGLFVSSLGSKTTDSYEVFSPYLMWFHHDLIHLTLQNWCSTLPPHLSDIYSRVFVLFSFLFSTISDRSNNPSGEIFLVASKIPGLASSPNDVGGTWKHLFYHRKMGGGVPWWWIRWVKMFVCHCFWFAVSKILKHSPFTWGNDPIWRAYFSDGLVQPPTRFVFFNGWFDGSELNCQSKGECRRTCASKDVSHATIFCFGMFGLGVPSQSGMKNSELVANCSSPQKNRVC